MLNNKYFISYCNENGENLGFLCYTGIMSKAWLKEHLFDKTMAVLFISDFTESGHSSIVSYKENGFYKDKIYDFIQTGPDSLDKVWCDLKNDDNDLHILSFKNLTNEYKED